MANKNYREFVRDQGGISDFVFRYSIRSHAGGFEGHSAVHFGWEGNNELLVTSVLSNQTSDLPPKTHSFLSLNPENAVVTALKVAEEGPEKGLIVRAWETDGKATQVTFDVSSLEIKSAVKTDLLERDQENLVLFKGKISVSIPAHGFVTVRLKSST
jgi:alpha-mannosidase